jgi:2-amino-4-hydroxy-6-hydroxymethyldihydropteridine diphosphokinase
MHQVYLSLGSNLGDRKDNLAQAIRLIGERVGEVLRKSSFLETQPWGFESDNLFVNACVLCETTLTPRQVLRATQKIERELGRTHKSVNGHYADRLIDIDILLYDDLRVDEPDLQIPHPLMFERDFVIIPLGEIRD